MNRNIAREKRGLSPVIATVILISVTIVVAVSVAYWMGSIASGYTTFEQIELPTVYARWDSSLTRWNVTIELKNTGSADATIDNIFINGIPLKDYTSGRVWLSYDSENLTTSSDLASISISITKGNSKTLLLQIQQNSNDGFTSGTRIDIKLHTAAGREYPAQVKLP